MSGAGDAGPPESPAPAGAREQAEWLQLLQLTADTGSDLGQLLVLELRLALASLGRMLLLALAFLPLLLLAWLGLTLLPAVLLYQHSGSPALGVLLFLAIQLMALGGIAMAWLRYRKGLGLPRTRRQWRAFTGEGTGEGGGEPEVAEP
ncbi:hypothetical protein [Parahaliea mediterranea]|uniref:Uncharacterized protein n=1 Tax=Parahaliea mediterranea TaxID=651086 RepID=A0A939DFF4_9GAMM|nr:hypothetical protein [Parahaliea mediterranea]MBN7796537.1 hypothetical protein [Parahaliea mediterranea]